MDKICKLSKIERNFLINTNLIDWHPEDFNSKSQNRETKLLKKLRIDLNIKYNQNEIQKKITFERLDYLIQLSQ